MYACPAQTAGKKYVITIKNSFLTQIPQLLDRLGISYPIFWNIIIYVRFVNIPLT